MFKEINWFVKFWSYLFPWVYKHPSDFNGTLELTYYQGKKILNTKNANYSYGTLQTILETGLHVCNISHCNHILLLGLGGGSIISSLRNLFLYNKKITAVELDAKIIAIAAQEFQIYPTKNLDIIHANALDFIQQTNPKFELIIVDLFIDDQLCDFVWEPHFWNQLNKSGSLNHQILVNLGFNKKNTIKLNQLTPYLHQCNYQTQIISKIQGNSTVLIATKN